MYDCCFCMRLILQSWHSVIFARARPELSGHFFRYVGVFLFKSCKQINFVEFMLRRFLAKIQHPANVLLIVFIRSKENPTISTMAHFLMKEYTGKFVTYFANLKNGPLGNTTRVSCVYLFIQLYSIIAVQRCLGASLMSDRIHYVNQFVFNSFSELLIPLLQKLNFLTDFLSSLLLVTPLNCRIAHVYLFYIVQTRILKLLLNLF